MAGVEDTKDLGAGFSNKGELVRVVWDFSVDGGALGDLDLLTADGAMIVKMRHAYVSTAVTSGGSMDLDVGKGAGGVEFLSSVAVASLTANSVQASATEQGIYLADNEVIVMGIDVATATAGKIEFVFELFRV